MPTHNETTDSDNEAYVKFFRQSSPYIHAHHSKTFVITLSGEALAHKNLPSIINDIALLSSLGVRLILAYGARPQVEQRIRDKGIESRFLQEKRITDRACLECVKDSVGNLRALIESRLSAGLVNSPMHGASIRVVSGNFVTARPMGVIEGEDLQYTGELRRIDHQAIQQLLDHHYIVLLSCLGLSPTGEVFNIDIEDIATHAAISLNAEKLLIYTGSSGLRKNDQLIDRISPVEANEHLSSQSPEIKRALNSGIQACLGGVERTHLISYRNDGSLLTELFTRKGTGTMIFRDRYEEIRPANTEDIPGILELIRPLERKGILRRRSRKKLEQEIQLFRVISLDDMIIDCAALNCYAGTRVAELACLVIHQDYQKEQRGDLLLEAIEKQALVHGIEQLFVLTTNTRHWFIEKGFTDASINALPEQKRLELDAARQSKILIKAVSNL